MPGTNLRAPWYFFIPYLFTAGIILAGFYVERYYGNVMFPLWLAYCIIPILDYLLPVDHYNLPDHQIKAYEKDWRFMVPLYIGWFADFAMYFYALYLFTINYIPSTIAIYFLYVFAVANSGALNLVIGHELVHRKELVHKIFGNLVYSKMMYSHFIIQHIKSHHKKVATPEDPSTSRKGESIWDFLIRTIPEGYAETW